MRLASIAAAITLGSVLVGCGGGGKPQVKIGPPPSKHTRGSLSGQTCDAGTASCKCRSGDGDGGVGVPDDGRKRFEIKLESAYDLWVTLPGDTTLYKSPETARACFYVDMSPGKQPMSIRASNKDGVSFAVEVHELGTKTHAWYDTFEFKCGHPGVCSFDELDSKKAQYAGVRRGLHDACGSTKIKGLAWDHGRSPDMQHPSELQVELQLDIYKFAPWKMPGDSTCGEGGGRHGDTFNTEDRGEPVGEPPATEPAKP